MESTKEYKAIHDTILKDIKQKVEITLIVEPQNAVHKNSNVEKNPVLYDTMKSNKETDNERETFKNRIFTIGETTDEESKTSSSFSTLNELEAKEINDQSEQNQVSNKKWLVLFAAFVSVALSTGFPFNMAVLYVEWLEEFGQSNSATAVVQSVATGVLLMGGCVSGVLITKFGPCTCGMIGGVLSTLGLGLSFFASSLLYLTVFSGVMAGFGFSLSYISASTSVGMYFHGKQRLLALSLASSGGGVGSSTLPMLLSKLIQLYSWRGGMLIMAGVMSNLVLCAALYTKPKVRNNKYMKWDPSQENPISICKNCDTPETTSLKTDVATPETTTLKTDVATPETTTLKTDVVTPETTTLKTDVVTSEETKDKSLKRVSFSTTELRRLYEKQETPVERKMTDVLKQLITNKVLMFYITGQALCIAAFNSILIFIIDYYEFKGITRSDAISIFTYTNVIGIFVRFLPGLLKQLPHVSVVAIPGICALLGSTAMFSFPLTGDSFYENLGVACVFGTGLSGMVTVMSISIIKLGGEENYAACFGLALSLAGVMNACVGPVAGYLKDVTGSYNTTLYGAASVLLFASSLFLITVILRRFKKEKSPSRFDFEMIIRRKSRRRSSIIPWRKGSIDISSQKQ